MVDHYLEPKRTSITRWKLVNFGFDHFFFAYLEIKRTSIARWKQKSRTDRAAFFLSYWDISREEESMR